MNTAEIITLSLAALAGVLIGTLFFAGLWWTVVYGLRNKRPALVFVVSLLARFGLALIGFYVVGGAHLERLAACLIGFVASRLVIARLLRDHLGVVGRTRITDGEKEKG
jgi:F1F0 ATPase subunit 2